jgi:hypothetical protein
VSVRAWALCLLLAVAGVAAGQEAQEPQEPPSTTDKAAHALMRDTLLQAELWLLEDFVQPGKDVPTVVLKELERLDTAVQDSYFRDLAQRSGMLIFVTREESRLAQERRSASVNAQKLLLQSLEDRKRERKRRATATVFWTSLGTALAGFAGSYGCWCLSEHLDRRYLSTPSPGKAALYKAWSDLLEGVSYLSAGVGAVGVTIALPALAGMRQR